MPLIILRGPLRGYKWIAGAAAGEAKGLSIILNFCEQKQIKAAKELLRADNICFDIGANVGLYSLLFARYCKKVYSFEPLPRNISYLYRILKLNDIKNVIIIPCAVADKRGIYLFKEGKNHSAGKLNNRGYQPISVISLDNFVKHNNNFPNIIKIDVEGAELLVLKGSKMFILEYKPIILLSTHGDNIKIDCLNFLNKLNYRNFKPINTNSIKTATEFLIMQ